MNYNTVDFYRFYDRTCDLFREDDHYLYATAEPFGWVYMLACRPVTVMTNLHGEREYIIDDAVGADCEYLANLEPVPLEEAAQIIDMIEEWEFDRLERLEETANE